VTVLVERPGLLTTVQDDGRWGLQHLGVSVSGWMDGWSARLANRLAGNPDDAAVLEVTWIGPVLRMRAPATVAVAGAAFDVVVGDEALRVPFVRAVRAGTTIAFGNRHGGSRAYVAFGGGMAVPPVLGSRATDVRAGLGGVEGRRLRAGDVLPLGEPRGEAPKRHGEWPDLSWLWRRRLRVLPGPDAWNPAEAIAPLEATAWSVASASDRTGYRLEGGAPLPRTGGERPSQPAVMGAIQAPPGGLPLLLMADRQTTGGYAIVAVVAAADLPVAGQLGPGDTCRFAACSWDEAEAAARARERALDAAAERIA
jgi:biotin-dependent carboxylase-like uncharacterized protein